MLSRGVRSSVLRIGREHCGGTRAELYLLISSPSYYNTGRPSTITRVAGNRVGGRRINCKLFAAKIRRSRASKSLVATNMDPVKRSLQKGLAGIQEVILLFCFFLTYPSHKQPSSLGLVCCVRLRHLLCVVWGWVVCCVRLRHCITSCSDSSRWTRQETEQATL